MRKASASPKTFAVAARWYRRAGLKGHRVAQLNLGELYQLGRGVPQDSVEAYLWYSLAAEGGQPLGRECSP